jgi:hypothetical protein
MKTIRFALGSLLFIICFASASMAQFHRTFVSGLGNDSNPCTRTAPCRTFAQAVSVTGRGGEVVALDSAGYGPVTLNIAISITAPPGVYAGISVSSGDGIDINAAGGEMFVLRGLTINNQGSSSGSGVVLSGFGTLHIEGCDISGFSPNFAQSAILFQGVGRLRVNDSVLKDNRKAIQVQPDPNLGTAIASIDHVKMEGGASGQIGDGITAADGTKVFVSNSIATQLFTRFVAISNNKPAELNMENCAAFANFAGVIAQNNSTGVATLRISNSTVTDNGTGLFNANSGANCMLLSRGNNTVEGNTTDTNGTIGSYTAK